MATDLLNAIWVKPIYGVTASFLIFASLSLAGV